MMNLCEVSQIKENGTAPVSSHKPCPKTDGQQFQLNGSAGFALQMQKLSFEGGQPEIVFNKRDSDMFNGDQICKQLVATESAINLQDQTLTGQLMASGFMSYRMSKPDKFQKSGEKESADSPYSRRNGSCSKQKENDFESDSYASVQSVGQQKQHQVEQKPMQDFFQSLQSTEKNAEGKTLPETQNNNGQETLEAIIENVADLKSYHSKMSGSPLKMEQASAHESMRSSKISTKAKKQKVTKRVNFFCLRPENVVDLDDIDSQQVLDDFDNCDIEQMNKSIEQDNDYTNGQALKLKRNPKSFNYSHAMWTDSEGLAQQLMNDNRAVNMTNTPMKLKS